MASQDSFDLIVIGGGPAGYVCAIRGAQLGLKTACIESRESLGGTCLNVGCIPSKALLESSHLYHLTQHELADHGIKVKDISFNLSEMIERKRQVVSSITKGVESLLAKNKVSWLKGFGRLKSSSEVAVVGADGKESVFQAKNIVIATGSEPIELPSAKFDHQFIVDSTDALEFSSVPKDLIVIGGGVIGLELGSVWNRLGSKVQIIEATPSILGLVDQGVAQLMLRIFKKQGMEFHLNTMMQQVEVANGRVRVVCKQGDQEIVCEGDRVLVAVGRKPHTSGLGLEALGVALDSRGRIETNEHWQTNLPHVYAVGDVIAGPMLAHKAEEEGIAVAETIVGKSGHVNYQAIPSVVYTWPEAAWVGLSEEECKQKNIQYNKGQFQFRANGRAKAMGQTEGFVKILADKETDRVLGVHIVGPSASELIAEAAIAMEYSASAEDIARSVHAHPTLAEAIKEAALGVDNRMIHS